MIVAYYLAALMLLYLSFRSFRGGIGYLEYFRSELKRSPGNFTPFATVIVPCKGVDTDLESNLRAILEQDYTHYEVVFVVDSEIDAAAPFIESAMRRSERVTRLVIAPQAVESSQKVENLREAVLHASDESEVFVFSDSDIRPAKDWLRSLIAPLEDPDIGAATGYRWFISEPVTFGSELRSAWNASIASALGPNRKSNFCWGGSMAVRRESFDRLDIREKWRGTLSDDFTVTRAVRAAGLSIYFVPHALTASVGTCSLRQTLEFTNRQMKITRVYSPDLWLLSFFGSALFNLVMLSSLLIVALSPRNDLNFVIAGIVLALVSFFSIGKSVYRLKAVKLVLEKHWPTVRRQWVTQYTLWLFTPALFVVNCIAAALSRCVTWRGIRYELKSPNETVIISG